MAKIERSLYGNFDEVMNSIKNKIMDIVNIYEAPYDFSIPKVSE
jgi:hypothetical protein